MILKYYGISGARDDIQARADFMALHVDLVVSPPPSPQPQQPHAYPWEERRQVARAFRETVHRACGITVEAEFIDVHETFLENFIRLLPYLSYGHPLQVRIIGGHIIVVRGAVIKRDESELWAICNDPYGTLAGQTANYRNTTNPYIWYEQEGQGSSSRRGRNLEGVDAAQQNEAQQNEDEAQRQQRRKGQHVYYNQTVHTRGGDRHFNFTYFVYMLYRHANDASMRRKDFVQAKLTRGE